MYQRKLCPWNGQASKGKRRKAKSEKGSGIVGFSESISQAISRLAFLLLQATEC